MVHFRRVLVAGWVLALFSAPGLAQERTFELIVDLGYTASSGVDISLTDIGGGQTVDRIAPKSGFSYGGTFNVFLTEAISGGFQFAQQNSKLEGRIVGGSKEEFADMKVNNYHGILTFHLAEEDSPMRPYFLVGLGATNYRASEPRAANLPSGSSESVESRTRFSTTWGGGIKIFPNESIGFQAQIRWTPTYIRTDPTGYWCSPFWPWQCWIVGNDQYSHQAEFGGGVVFRF